MVLHLHIIGSNLLGNQFLAFPGLHGFRDVGLRVAGRHVGLDLVVFRTRSGFDALLVDGQLKVVSDLQGGGRLLDMFGVVDAHVLEDVFNLIHGAGSAAHIPITGHAPVSGLAELGSGGVLQTAGGGCFAALDPGVGLVDEHVLHLVPLGGQDVVPGAVAGYLPGSQKILLGLGKFHFPDLLHPPAVDRFLCGPLNFGLGPHLARGQEFLVRKTDPGLCRGSSGQKEQGKQHRQRTYRP